MASLGGSTGTAFLFRRRQKTWPGQAPDRPPRPGNSTGAPPVVTSSLETIAIKDFLKINFEARAHSADAGEASSQSPSNHIQVFTSRTVVPTF